MERPPTHIIRLSKVKIKCQVDKNKQTLQNVMICPFLGGGKQLEHFNRILTELSKSKTDNGTHI